MSWFSEIPYLLPSALAYVLESAALNIWEILMESKANVVPQNAQPSPAHSMQTSEWMKILEDAMSDHSEGSGSQQHRGAPLHGGTSVAGINVISFPLTSDATLDSKHSCFPPFGESLLSDSYNYRALGFT
ncbi:hypothetical protein M758_UG344900 [Ceratodon purpureus]|nr:hypothetical protein M758_UG344900 [Ceratodon purpureus]